MKTKTQLIKHTLLIVGLMMGLNGWAQQDPMYSQYMFNTLAVNPAYAGHEGTLSASLLARAQWISFDGAPSTQTLLVHAPLKKENMGWGLSIVNDQIGPVKQTGIFGDFSYKVKMTSNSDLTFGLKAGGNLFQVGLADIDVHTAGDVAFSQNVSGFLPNVGFGMLYEAKDYYIGLSFPRLRRNDIGAGNSDLVLQEERRHFFLTAGYEKELNENVTFKPTIMWRKVKNAPMSLDLGANFLLQQKLWLGAMYRLGDSFGVNVQYLISDQFRIGYAFDLTTSSLGQYNSGTHELLLRFDLKKKPEGEAQDPTAQ